jgi:hypothetical protein
VTYRLRTIGQRGERREPALRRMREATSQRAGYRCEWQAGCPTATTDPAHGWGRGNLIATVLADHPALAWRACRWHHLLADGHRKPADEAEVQQLEEQRWWLVGMAVAEFGDVPRDPEDRPANVIQRIERMLDAEGTLAEWRTQRKEASRR